MTAIGTEKATNIPGVVLRLTRRGGRGWEVVHHGSGIAIIGGYHSLPMATLFVEELVGAPIDWEQDAASLARAVRGGRTIRDAVARGESRALAAQMRDIAAAFERGATIIEAYIAARDLSATAQRDAFLEVFRAMRGTTKGSVGSVLSTLYARRVRPKAVVEAGKQLGVRL